MIQMNVDEIMFTLQKNIELPAKFWQDFSPILGSIVEVFAEHCEVAEGVFVLDQLAAALEGEEGDTISPMASGNPYSATAYSRLSKAEKWSYVLQWQATQRDSMSLRRKYINRRRIVINNAMKDINSMGVEAFFCMASGNARNGSKKLHKPLIVSGEHARSFLVKIMDLMKPETGGKRVSPHIAFGRHIYHAWPENQLKGSSMKAREKIRGLLAADNNSDDILLEDGRTLRDCRFMFAHENQEHNKFQYFINDPTSFFPHRFLWKDATHVTEEQTRKIRAKYKKMHGIPKRSCKLVTTKSPARIKKKKKKRAANAAETPARRTRPRLTAD
ncbi:hypothetical protein BC940DRAFT_297970 [Gongronella butleri]|nr:hypothetical protein BC940DRAFT_297970 [Gongronella butleri]